MRLSRLSRRSFGLCLGLCAFAAASCSASTSPLPIEPMFELDPADVSLQVGSAQQFSAILFGDPSGAAVLTDVGWSSSDESVVSIDARGLATAKHEGDATIVALRKGVTAVATVLVSDVRLTQIIVAPRSASIAAGTSLQLTASGRYSDGSLRPLQGAGLQWSTSGEIARVDANGIVTALERGTTMIKVSSGEILGSSELRVSGAEVQALQVDPPSAVVAPGAQLPLRIVGTFSDGSLQDLTTQMSWVSSAENVAIVSYQGIVHALSAGSATISASYQDMTVSMQLTVMSSL